MTRVQVVQKIHLTHLAIVSLAAAIHGKAVIAGSQCRAARAVVHVIVPVKSFPKCRFRQKRGMGVSSKGSGAPQASEIEEVHAEEGEASPPTTTIIQASSHTILPSKHKTNNDDKQRAGSQSPNPHLAYVKHLPSCIHRSTVLGQSGLKKRTFAQLSGLTFYKKQWCHYKANSFLWVRGLQGRATTSLQMMQRLQSHRLLGVFQ